MAQRDLRGQFYGLLAGAQPRSGVAEVLVECACLSRRPTELRGKGLQLIRPFGGFALLLNLRAGGLADADNRLASALTRLE